MSKEIHFLEDGYYVDKLEKDIEKLKEKRNQLQTMVKTYKDAFEEVREYINSYDVFKEFSFPLMKRDEENQTKSSIKYEFDTSIKKELLQILDKVKEN